MAVRSALGAGRRRLIVQLLTESGLLAFVGGGIGLILAGVIVDLFSTVKSSALPTFTVIRVNESVLFFTLAVSVITGLLFGIVPALQTARPDVHEELKGGAGSSISPTRRRRLASNTLMVGEIALSLLLLISAGLLLEDFVRLRLMNIGVRTAGVWTAAVQLPEERYKTQQDKFSFSQSLLARVSRIGGVDAAALSDRLPLEGGSNGYIKVRGQVMKTMSGPLVETHAVSPGYFGAMGIRLLAGRDFNDNDVQTALRHDQRIRELYAGGAKPAPDVTNAVVYPSIINDTMRQRFWPNQNPIGAMFSHGSDNGPWHQVIGVVSDVKQWGLAEKPQPEGYDVFDGDSGMYVVLHTSMRPSSLTSEVRRVVTEVDSSLPLFSVRTMDQVVAEQAQGQQFLSFLVGAFAAIAALLAAVGIYGVLSYAVTQRTREIGIRMSLGASHRRVMRQILTEGMGLAGIGFGCGIVAALAARKIIASVLHEVKPGDPLMIAVALLFLAAVAFAACYVPARRAARLDPTVALRHE
jgi:putative ABC transport system permease protein